MKTYYRPIIRSGLVRPEDAVSFGTTRFWVTEVEVLSRTSAPRLVPFSSIPHDEQARILKPRAKICGLDFDHPIIMGILNVTPDSFSDGGKFIGVDTAIAHAKSLVEGGSDLIDIGGESTRPGAVEVEVAREIDRTAPVIKALAPQIKVPISIDTRKTPVAQKAVQAGASILNDISGLEFDPTMAEFAASNGHPICIMHSQGTPATMQDNPTYDDAVLDVYDFLEDRIQRLEGMGLARDQIIADPGIGFGKTLKHNLALLNRICLFHSLGVPILLGVSRKGMIRTVGEAEHAEDRVFGSISVALAARAQGVQIFRVHDVWQTKQAFKLWNAVEVGEDYVA